MLQSHNTEKFDLVKEYVRGEKSETKKLQTELARVLQGRSDLTMSRSFAPGFSGIIRATSTEQTSGSSREYAKKLRTLNDRIIPSMMAIASGKSDDETQEIRDLGADLVS